MGRSMGWGYGTSYADNPAFHDRGTFTIFHLLNIPGIAQQPNLGNLLKLVSDPITLSHLAHFGK